MRSRPLFWAAISLLCLGGAFYFWRLGDRMEVERTAARRAGHAREIKARLAKAPGRSAKLDYPDSTAPLALLRPYAHTNSTPATNVPNPFRFRLSNTTKTDSQLDRDDRIVRLENAIWDTTSGGMVIPEKLRANRDAGSYIVQARHPLDDNFRALLKDAGAEIISYIPNNSYLVRMAAPVAARLSGNPEAQAVLAWEPYYKLKTSLLQIAVEDAPLPYNAELNLLVFPGAREQTLAQLKELGAQVTGEDTQYSIIKVRPPSDSLAAIAKLNGVEYLEASHSRTPANDLSRAALNVATNTLSLTNWLGLTGTNVTVNEIDTWVYGVDSKPEHPDLAGRLWGPVGAGTNLLDYHGHAMHVAGIIAGNGMMSTNPVNVGSNASGSVAGASFRGMAPGAAIYGLPVNLFTKSTIQNRDGVGPLSDGELQELAASSNGLISNLSWNYGDAPTYDLAAASYDAATRDAQPGVPGSRQMLFVVAAGNNGNGNTIGLSGFSDSILSPATAKNALTVGAMESKRSITNKVIIGTTTNTPWLAMTDDPQQVAPFSSRGNVGIGVEGGAGRFKPDVVAPGTFVVSTRSTNWDRAAYFNPTNIHRDILLGKVAETNFLDYFPIGIPDNAVELHLTIVTNSRSPFPMRSLTIYGKEDDFPDTNFFDLKTTNTVSIPGDFPTLNPDVTWWFAVENTNGITVNYDVITDLVTTNDAGDTLTVLSNLNDTLGPYYRYESGTSMSAAGVSGLLALMQEFFEQRLHVTNSPAMMKALMINGSRGVNTLYDFQVRNTINFEGWGMPNIQTILPGALSNSVSHLDGPMQFYDQSPTNALATGQSKTYTLKIDNVARALPLRVTLVWTDPPGNPAAATKLVNDLDLVVTNLDDPGSPIVYFGNDIQTGATINSPWDTNTAPAIDSVNNVENVYLAPNLGSNYTVTVRAQRVNVNALTAHPNNVVQDYALVISSGNGEVSNAVNIVEGPLTNLPPVAFVTPTNAFASSNVVATILLNERVGANTPLLGTTNGITNQWHFYRIENTNAFANAAFVTFQPANLAVPRMGTRSSTTEAARFEGDIDLYVSLDPGLTNLSPTAIDASAKSRRRGGTEYVILSNAVAGPYYVGVKSEDQMAAEYGFLAIFSRFPFSTESNGVVTAEAYLVPAAIPDGSASDPGALTVLALVAQPIKVREVVVTNGVTHQKFGDLLGNLYHDTHSVVLNNHRGAPEPPTIPGPYVFTYEDNGELSYGLYPKVQHSDGPGSLRDFVGEEGIGPWFLTMLDNHLSQTGTVDRLTIHLLPQDLDDGASTRTIQPNSWTYDFIDVPAEATNLEVTVALVDGSAGPVDLVVRKGVFPTLTEYDKFLEISGAGAIGVVDITKFDFPPLTAARYYIGVYNNSSSPQNVKITAKVSLDTQPITPTTFVSLGNEVLMDDAVTYSQIDIANHAKIAEVEVGLRIEHPRVSDLAITLISPRGNRILLSENRGRDTTLGFGDSTTFTNFIPVSSSGGEESVTNLLDTGTTSGTLIIDYQFYSVPDQMTIYYEGAKIFDTGNITGSGRFTVPYGRGTSTFVTIIMNEHGGPPGTLWDYTIGSTKRVDNYAIFTENTNKAPQPIKFTPPPFAPVTVGSSGLGNFDGDAIQDYPAGSLLDGWTVVSNRVTVGNSPPAASAPNFLALRNGQMQRAITTTPGHSYILSFAARSAVLDGLISWWPGENTAQDNEETRNDGNLLGTTVFVPGEVGQAFQFDGRVAADRVNLGNPTSLHLQDFTIEGWVKRGSSAFISYNDTESLVAEGGMILSYGTGGFGFGLLDNGQMFLRKVDVDAGTVTPAPVITDTNWHHAAVSKVGGVVAFYVDGAVIASAAYAPATPFVFTNNVALGARGDAHSTFFGGIDELAIFNRALAPAEIATIYNASTNGKCGMIIRPNSCSPPGAILAAVGRATNHFVAISTNWTAYTLAFTATTNTTLLTLTPSFTDAGVLVDTFNLTESQGNLYFQPEETLDDLKGQDVAGPWLLEVWDNRAGATSPAPVLVSWSLDFVYQDEVPRPRPLTPSVAVTNAVPPGQTAVYYVDVPDWVNFATNRLTSGSTLDFLYSKLLPAGGPPWDATLAENTANVFNRAASTPLLTPGRYYLGVHNPSTTASASYVIEVDFDLRQLFDAIPVTNTIPSGTVTFNYFFDVLPGPNAEVFQVTNMNGNVNLIVRKAAVPDPLDFDYGSFTPGSVDEEILVLTNSTPVPFSPGRWFLSVNNADASAVTYVVVASTFTNFPRVITLTNGIAYTTTNGATGSADYYRYIVSTNAQRAQFEIIHPENDMNLLARKGLPLPGPAPYVSLNPGTNGEVISLFTNSTPVRLTAGEWFLAATNISALAPLNYTIKATEWSISARPLLVSLSISATNVCIIWNSLPGAHYYLQGLPTLGSPEWSNIPPVITATGGVTTECFDFPPPYSFFRVVEGIIVTP